MQVLALLTFFTWSVLGDLVHLDGLADDDDPVASVVFTEFIKDAPEVRITNRIPVNVPVPHPVRVDRVRTVQVPQPRPYPVDSPYPVPVPRPFAYPVPEDVPVPVSYPLPYALPHLVPVPVRQPVPFPVSAEVGHRYAPQLIDVPGASDTVITGPSVGTLSFFPQYQTSTGSQKTSQQSDGTSTNLPSPQNAYSASTASDADFASQLLPLLEGYLDIFQHQRPQESTSPQEVPAQSFPVSNESNSTLEGGSGEQSSSLLIPTVGNHLDYGPQPPSVPQSLKVSTQAGDQKQREVQENGSTTGQLSETKDQNGTSAFSFAGSLQPVHQTLGTALPPSYNYLYNSKLTYPYGTPFGATNALLSTQPYPYFQSLIQSQPTVNQIPGSHQSALSAANSGSSGGDNTRQTGFATTTDFLNYINYANAQLLPTLFSRHTFHNPPLLAGESPVNLKQTPGSSGNSDVRPATTESPKPITAASTTTVSSSAPPVSTSSRPGSIKNTVPAPAMEEERLETRRPNVPKPLSEPPTTSTTADTTQLAETSTTVTTSKPQVTSSVVVKPSPTPEEPRNVQIQTQFLPKQENAPEAQYRLVGVPLVQSQLASLPQHQHLHVVVTHI